MLDASKHIVFGTATTELARITGNGNMGIVTNTLVTALQINAPTDNGVYIGSGTAAGSYPSWLVTNGL